MWLFPCFPTFLFKSTSEVGVGSLVHALVCGLRGVLLRVHLLPCIYRGVAVLGPRGIKWLPMALSRTIRLRSVSSSDNQRLIQSLDFEFLFLIKILKN
jgi:hypothetical protein